MKLRNLKRCVTSASSNNCLLFCKGKGKFFENRTVFTPYLSLLKFFIEYSIDVTTFLYFFSWTPVYELFSFEGFDTYVYGLIKSANILSIIFTVVGFAKTKLNKPSPLLKYANESVYPFYILHQTITLTVGYYIKDWQMNVFLKFLLLAAATFGGCFLIYELLIKRLNLTRVLFGLKPKTKKVSFKLSQEKIETGKTDYLAQG